MNRIEQRYLGPYMGNYYALRLKDLEAYLDGMGLMYTVIEDDDFGNVVYIGRDIKTFITLRINVPSERNAEMDIGGDTWYYCRYCGEVGYLYMEDILTVLRTFTKEGEYKLADVYLHEGY